jgi:hypothetical protein
MATTAASMHGLDSLQAGDNDIGNMLNSATPDATMIVLYVDGTCVSSEPDLATAFGDTAMTDASKDECICLVASDGVTANAAAPMPTCSINRLSSPTTFYSASPKLLAVLDADLPVLNAPPEPTYAAALCEVLALAPRVAEPKKCGGPMQKLPRAMSVVSSTSLPLISTVFFR